MGEDFRSPHTHARIARIDTSRAEKAPGVRAVLTGADAWNTSMGRRYRDISVLAQDRVRFRVSAAAAVAAHWKRPKRRLSSLMSFTRSFLPSSIQRGFAEGSSYHSPGCEQLPGLPKPLETPSNAFVRDVWTHGDIAEGFARSDLVVENTFTSRAFIRHF